MDLLVALFFIHSTLANFIVGLKFYNQKQSALRYFGMGLLLTGLAFAVWTTAVLFKPTNLDLWITVGVVPFYAALLYYLATGSARLKAETRKNVLLLAVVAAVSMFVLRTYIIPSHPGFSNQGLFFFNLNSTMKALYVVAIVVAFLPAVGTVASKIKSAGLRNIFRAATITLTIGGIILITSNDTSLLLFDGWAMGLAYLIMWTSLAFSDSKVFAKT